MVYSSAVCPGSGHQVQYGHQYRSMIHVFWWAACCNDDTTPNWLCAYSIGVPFRVHCIDDVTPVVLSMLSTVIICKRIKRSQT